MHLPSKQVFQSVEHFTKNASSFWHFHTLLYGLLSIMQVMKADFSDFESTLMTAATGSTLGESNLKQFLQTETNIRFQ